MNHPSLPETYHRAICDPCEWAGEKREDSADAATDAQRHDVREHDGDLTAEFVERELVTDGGLNPERTAWVTGSRGNCGATHTDPDCQFLQRANSATETTVGEAWKPLCRRCAGTAERIEDQDHSLHQKLKDPDYTGERLMTDGGEEYPFEYDPRNLPRHGSGSVTPAVIGEHTESGTERLSVADATVEDSGAVRFREWSGRVGYLPEWRWTEVKLLETEVWRGPDDDEPAVVRVTAEDWHLLADAVCEAVENPHEKRLMTDGGVEIEKPADVLSPEQAGDRERVEAYRAMCSECDWYAHTAREKFETARSDAETHNRLNDHASIGADVQEVPAVRIGNIHLGQVSADE